MPRQHRLKNSPNRRRTKNLADVGQNITDRCQPNHPKTNPNHFLSIPIHKQHQNSLQIGTFHQYSSNNQKSQFQNSKPQMLKLPFLNIIHFLATLKLIHNNLCRTKKRAM